MNHWIPEEDYLKKLDEAFIKKQRIQKIYMISAVILGAIISYFLIEAFFSSESLTSKPQYKIRVGTGTQYQPKN